MIPVVAFKRFGPDLDGFACDLGHACREAGFFLLTGHGIAPRLTTAAVTQAARFVAQPDAAKAPLSILTDGANRGGVPAGAVDLRGRRDATYRTEGA